jgi:type 1 glutamine amidotransferase
LAKAPRSAAEQELRALDIVLLADVKDHGPGAHDYPLWQKRWGLLLGGKQVGAGSETQVNLDGPPAAGNWRRIAAGAPKVNVATAWKWPSKEQMESAELIVMFCYRSGGGERTWSDQRREELEAYLSRGGGFVAVHSATYTPQDLSAPNGDRVAALTGAAFDRSIQVRHGAIALKITAPDDPICLGLPGTIDFVDEPYWPPRGDLSKVRVLAASEERIQKDADPTAPQPMFWTHQHGEGRVFACVLGHFNWTFDDPYFRILLLRGMAWAAGESPYRFDPLVLRGAKLTEDRSRQ